MKQQIYQNGVIYIYTCIVNQKVYIGQTTRERDRKAEHKRHTHDSLFHRAIAKYGFENFKYEVLFQTKSADTSKLQYLLNIMEIYFIRRYNSTDPFKGYNIVSGGNTTLGFRMSEEIRNKISEGHKGKKFTEEHKKNISEALKGRCISERQKSNISKDRMRKYNNGKIYKIEMYDLQNNLIQTFNTLTDCSKFVKRNSATISEGLKNPNYICAKKYKLKKVFYED